MLTESMEDYLETIYRLKMVKGYVRAVDLSEALNVQSSSVTRMIQKLDESDYLVYEKYRNISLTPKGEIYGEFLVWRDATLKQFLRLLNAKVGIDEQVEGMEHYITPATMGLIRNLITFFSQNPKLLGEFHALQQVKQYPDQVDLRELRAWEFRHNQE